MSKDNDIRRYLAVIRKSVALIEGLLENDGGLTEQLAGQPVVAPQPVVQQPVVDTAEEDRKKKEFLAARKKHIDSLMGIDCWPEAVAPHLITNPSKLDQSNRAKAVLDMMVDRPLEGQKFLDYGCGEGWIAYQAIQRGVGESTGFDIQKNEVWAGLTGPTYTSDYALLKEGHYDIVMLYDVLDHCHDPIDLMAKVKRVLRPDGTVYVRCHPWTSKHATHIYKQGLNKSYLHLFLNQGEIDELLGDKGTQVFTRPEKKPLDAYRYWFSQFNVKKERLVEEQVSEFFHVPAFKELLANENQIPHEEIDDFLRRMKIQFVDYVLTPKR